MKDNKTILWSGSAIIRLSESTIATMDRPSRKRASVRFSFIMSRGRSIDIYDHRERSIISSRIYFENINIMRIDINRRANVTIKERHDGTRYIVLGDVPEKTSIVHALKESAFGQADTEWSSAPDKEDIVIAIERYKEDS